MAFEQYYAQEWKTVPSAPTSENFNGSFDCNICLDVAHEPIVTHCGHLYCWPCIYKWLHVQSPSLAPDEHPPCPVCKADISHTTMVPLYGRGQSETQLQGKHALYRGMVIPPRPPACANKPLLPPTSPNSQQLTYRNPYHNHDYHQDDLSAPPTLNTVTGFHHPVVGMFGEMVYARVFGNSESLYPNPNSYRAMGIGSPRLRRLEMQADRSLNRISIFLFCCLLLCLIVF
ncbi:heat stress transcription factor B-2a-like [Hibiscus syriacus]|uniref:E3 ubiquitin-protein ligase RMA n=2 Tax=Hibiscus syriacus TaxID=106335 RepID=A0A6A3ACB7_HIBSY|nr:E3 ubiquitin-protein ligase RMA1H1-like isoform X2 [Hibiscus syriacus]XP_039004522.1 E3 ubiquitin-protein ligase RMA1H1-like isoform X2 [Hibiscus syriacus]KAE8700509.1 heat stress transcription factor B-2a-like [Hibiscus syriacus]